MLVKANIRQTRFLDVAVVMIEKQRAADYIKVYDNISIYSLPARMATQTSRLHLW
jgi:hypothetical protein